MLQTDRQLGSGAFGNFSHGSGSLCFGSKIDKRTKQLFPIMRAPRILNTLTFAGLLQSVYCPINIIFKLSVC